MWDCYVYLNMAKLIRLKGCAAIVDDSDYDRVSKYKWWADHHDNGRIYARTKISGKKVRLHRFILDAKPNELVDHIGGNKSTLDCRRKNLRITTKQVNALNSKKSCKNSSGFRGVIFHPQTNKWRASIVLNGKRKSLGLHTSKVKAHKAYKEEYSKHISNT